jgi:glycosyltransferase involved in cell wall biosynthesis
VTSVAELKAKIKEDAEQQFKQQADQKFLNDVTESLIATTKFDLPASFLKKWIQTAGENPMNAEEAEAEYNKSENGLRYQLIEGKVMADNNLQITFEELKDYTSNVIKSDFYLLISRLVSWKRIDYVIETFNQNQLPLIIIGEGPEFKKLKQKSRNNITFTGYISEQEKNQYLKKASALIVPQNEDFGLVILEAINHFCPLLYLNSGGAKEIVSNKLGIGFSEPSHKSLNYAIECLGQVELDLKHREKILNYTSPTKFTSFLVRLINHKMLVKSKDFV